MRLMLARQERAANAILALQPSVNILWRGLCRELSTCINELTSVLRGDTFGSSSLVARDLDTGEQFNLAGNLLKRCIFRQLRKEVDNDLSVAHAAEIFQKSEPLPNREKHHR